MMNIQLVRIDDRLIHGQVATVWSKVTAVARILVVSDEVAQDEMRKLLLSQAVPPGVKANVVTIQKMLEVYTHPLFFGMKVMLLFTNPRDVVRVLRGGVAIKSVNIGGMSYSAGKRMITNFVSVDETDLKAFRYLMQRGVELEVRKVPADREIPLVDLLRKENLL